MKRLIWLALFPCFAWSAGGTLSDNGDTSEVTCSSGLFFVGLEGTWGSGTVTIYFKDAQSNWEEVRVSGTAKTTTSDDTYLVDLAAPATIKGTLAGATTPSLDYTINCASKR